MKRVISTAGDKIEYNEFVCALNKSPQGVILVIYESDPLANKNLDKLQGRLIVLDKNYSLPISSKVDLVLP